MEQTCASRISALRDIRWLIELKKRISSKR